MTDMTSTNGNHAFPEGINARPESSHGTGSSNHDRLVDTARKARIAA